MVIVCFIIGTLNLYYYFDALLSHGFDINMAKIFFEVKIKDMETSTFELFTLSAFLPGQIFGIWGVWKVIKEDMNIIQVLKALFKSE